MRIEPELVIAIIGIALSAGGLTQSLLMVGQQVWRPVILSMLFTGLILLGLVAVYGWFDQERDLSQTQARIVQLLGQNEMMTVDDLYAEIFPLVDFPTLTEALERSVTEGSVTHRIQEFSPERGVLVRFRVYSVPP